jgi:hypothetical protein
MNAKSLGFFEKFYKLLNVVLVNKKNSNLLILTNLGGGV